MPYNAMGVQERDQYNNVVNEYAWGQGLPGGIGGLLHLHQGGAHYSYLYDGKGNVTGLLDGSAGVAATYQYDPFGAPRGPANSLQQPFQFSTKPYDEKTGLSYYGYRFYVPALGRWLTRDPIGEAGGINLYGFVGNNAINSYDPYGLCPFTPPADEPSLRCPAPLCKLVFHPDAYWACVITRVSGVNIRQYAISIFMGATPAWPAGLACSIALAVSDAEFCRKIATFCDH